MNKEQPFLLNQSIKTTCFYFTKFHVYETKTWPVNPTHIVEPGAGAGGHSDGVPGVQPAPPPTQHVRVHPPLHPPQVSTLFPEKTSGYSVRSTDYPDVF